ncbi:MAG: tyrosine recombinase XerC [Chlamydiia bacterium]|nr:tyrosine recombinase XerC [Chlamydiia bacterium]
MIFPDALKQFLHHFHVIKGASEHTLRNYNSDLSQFHKFLPQNTPLSEINRGHIRQFLAVLNQQKKGRKTILRRLSSLRSFFKYALTEKWIKTNPCEDIESPRNPRKIPQTLSYNQVLTLLSQPDTQDILGFRDRTLMELIYSSGLRVSEVSGLNRQDFDSQNLLLRIRGKGKKERVIPITQNAANWINNYLHLPERPHLENDPDAIFINHRGTRLTTRSIDRLFSNYLKMSGLAGQITPHTIRHTIATHWLENGMDLKSIQTLLGHTCLTTTTLYTQVSPQLKKSVYDQTHPRA